MLHLSLWLKNSLNTDTKDLDGGLVGDTWAALDTQDTLGSFLKNFGNQQISSKRLLSLFTEK